MVSPLAHELELARTEGTLEVVRLVTRRRSGVRTTVLPELSDADVRAHLRACAHDEMSWWADVDAGEADR